MKKLAFAFGAIIWGFMLTSCGEPIKDSIIKEIDNYFTAAEQQLSEIDNSEDFLAFANAMSDRSDLLETLDEKYGNKPISEEDNEAVMNYASERATAYNHKEADKAAEYLTPAIENLEAALEELYAEFQAGEGFSEETIFNFFDAYEPVEEFNEYDNVLPELQERAKIIQDKYEEMSELINATLQEMFPDE